MMVLTNPKAYPHNVPAFDASGAGRDNPIEVRRTKRQSQALFLCLALIYGGWGGAGFGLAGSLLPVCHPRSSRHHYRRDNRRGGSNLQVRSHPMKTPSDTTGEIRPNSAQSSTPDTAGKVIHFRGRPTVSASLTMDEIERLAATDKRSAIQLALLAIRQGDEAFIKEVIAEAVTYREMMEYLRAMRRETGAEAVL